MAKVRFSNPATMAKPPGYTHVVDIAGPARLVYIAGQLGLDENNALVGAPGDFRAQATQAFENLRRALASVGASFADVVKINNYLADVSHMGIFREVRDRFVNIAAPPASTTLAISDFARPGALFEIEAIVALPAPAARAVASRRSVATRAKAAAKGKRSAKGKTAAKGEAAAKGKARKKR